MCVLIYYRLQNSHFFSKSVKKSVKRGVRVLRARRARASHTPPVSLSVFSLVPNLLFDCSRVLEYAKIRTVLQSKYTSIMYLMDLVFVLFTVFTQLNAADGNKITNKRLPRITPHPIERMRKLGTIW